MINRIYVIKSESYFPYHNQAVEDCLFETVPSDVVILYLWQNIDTVFIGRNQNAFNECDIDLMQKENCFLARRLSGGGAVFHDLGNLNFTFISAKENYDLEKQNEVILKALRDLDLDVTRNGRNDMEIRGRKFSGHAYYKGKKNAFHHGTLMLEVDEEKMQRYLNVSLLKLNAKEVSSVRSRVINLRDMDDEITVRILKRSLIDSFAEVYGLEPKPLFEDYLDEEMVKAKQEFFSDPRWRYGEIRELSHVKERRFDWGTVRLEYDLEGTVIKDLNLYTDSLNVDEIRDLPDKLKGKDLADLEPGLSEEADDIISLLKENEDAL